MKIADIQPVLGWLFNGEDWIRFNTLIHLYDLDEMDAQVVSAYQGMQRDEKVKALLADMQNWETAILKRHNDASHPIHNLSFLAEIGLKKKEPGTASSIQKITAHISSEGPFQSFSNYPTHFGGSGKDEWLWILCDAPLLVYNLAKLGMAEDSRVQNAYAHLMSLGRDNGWPCAACGELSKFRGPGKASDPCPYATLLMLKAAAALKTDGENEYVRRGIDTLFSLWQNSREQRPYLFKMGTNFRKLKVPFIWYDILHVLDVLSHFDYARTHPVFNEMLDVVLTKAGDDLKFTSESVWMKWKGWEFCQKREPSRWVTFVVFRILKRAGKLPAILPAV